MTAFILLNDKNKNNYFVKNYQKVIIELNKLDIEVVCLRPSSIEQYYSIVANNKIDILIVNGGDGTIHHIVNAVSELQVKPRILYFPTGTINDFAASLNLEKSIESQIQLVKKNQYQAMNFWQINNQIMNYAAAFGPFTSVGYKADPTLKKMIGPLAYYITAISEIPTINKDYQLTVEIDNERVIHGKYAIGVISNTNSIAGIRKIYANNDMLNHYANIALFPKLAIINGRVITELLLNGVTPELQSQGVIVEQFKNLKISSNEQIKWTIDGEVGPSGDLEIKPLASSIEIYTPLMEEKNE